MSYIFFRFAVNRESIFSLQGIREVVYLFRLDDVLRTTNNVW